MLLAFALANSSAREWYQVVHHLPVMVRVGALTIDKPLILWINDGLMVFFFLLIALELKREILEGQLSTPRSIATPGFAALGGMVVLALIYIAFNAGDPAAMRGRAIPTATDTVLALTVLVLLGARAPVSLKVFLTALAIFDDLGGDRGHCAVLYRATCHAVAGDDHAFAAGILFGESENGFVHARTDYRDAVYIEGQCTCNFKRPCWQFDNGTFICEDKCFLKVLLETTFRRDEFCPSRDRK